jgi:hypothetical protein
MIGPMRASVFRTAALTALCLALALPASGASAAEPSVHYTKESPQAYEQQLAAGQIQAAVINRRIGTVRLTLKDGRHYLVHYLSHDEPKVAAALAAKGVPVVVLKPADAKAEAAKVPVHHKLRYIAGGILIVVVIVVGAVLLVDRKRKQSAE